MSLFFRGVLMGLAIAAPVGPIGILCIRQTLAYGMGLGFVSGLGAATADGLYGSVAALGLSVVSNFLVNQQTPLRWMGGLFLCYLGIKTLLSAGAMVSHAPLPRPSQTDISQTDISQTRASPTRAPAAVPSRPSLLKTYGMTLALTLTNPATILSFTAIFAGLGIIDQPGDQGTALQLVLGVFTGSACWWLSLSGGVTLTRRKLGALPMQWINRLSGIILTIFGLVALMAP